MKPILPLHAWDIPNATDIKQVYTGLLNNTYIIKTGADTMYVLQRLHLAVALPGCTSNYFHVTHYLRDHHYVTQTVVKTKTGKFTYFENGTTWRLLLGVSGHVHRTTKNPKLAFEGGALMAQFHLSLQNYPKRLSKTLPMFQYSTVLKKLRSYNDIFAEMDDADIRESAQFLIHTLPSLLLPGNLPKQIIHTDPKVSNFLFTKQGAGICMIDLDTVQRLSPLYDIGDAIRSWCGQEEDKPKNTFNKQVYQSFMQGYLSNSKKFLTKAEQKLIPQACKLVMLGLATRFLNDYIDDSYFGWDANRYTNRKAHNKARVLGQISLYKSFDKD